MANKINKVVVMADITRCKNGTDGIINWLGGLMQGIITRICNVPFYMFTNEELKDLHINLYKAYNIDLTNNHLKYNFASVPTDYWVQLCFEEPNEKVLNLVQRYFGDALVITREPAYILKKSFEQLNIPYVDLALHSVRYMDDIIMGASSNVSDIYERIKKFEINEEEFYFYADLLKSEALFRLGCSYIKPDSNYALFLAQTPVDRSLLDMQNKKIVTFMDYKDKFEDLTKNHEIVYYKSHPYYKNDEVIKFIKSFKNVEICGNTNTYYLFSLPQFKTCASISSGSLKEAYYFGKKIICFLDQPYHYSEEYKNKMDLNNKIYITVGKHWLTAAFWADILSPLIETKKIYSIDINNVHNKFRRILNASWGYVDCDSTFALSHINDLTKFKDKINSNPDNKIIIPAKKSTIKKSIAHISTSLIPVKNIRRKLREKILNS